MVHVALLRGINLASRNRLSMRDMVSMFEEAGCRDVRTYIQSGNIVFDASADVAARVPAAIAAAIGERFGFKVPVVLRTAAELRAVTRKNPFLAAGADPDKLHVVFLADRPTRAAVAALDPRRSPGDELAVVGREVYLHMPNGIGRSKITTGWIDAKLQTISTIRNWRTVQTLLEMTST